MMTRLQTAADFIGARIAVTPRIGLVLGSGLDRLADQVEDAVAVAYDDIPHFSGATVAGHPGFLVAGTLGGREVAVLQGRLHWYEGLPMAEVVFPVRCLRLLGVTGLIVTNGAGSLRPEIGPGQLMLIRDHIKLVCDSPLRGPNLDALGPRFNDMSEPYPEELRTLARTCAAELGLDLSEGVYCYMPGPSYETASEVRLLALLGGSAVGMSTVPEVIAACHAGMRVLGLSCIANMGTGLLDRPLDHDEIIRAGERVREVFSALLKRIVARWPDATK